MPSTCQRGISHSLSARALYKRQFPNGYCNMPQNKGSCLRCGLIIAQPLSNGERTMQTLRDNTNRAIKSMVDWAKHPTRLQQDIRIRLVTLPVSPPAEIKGVIAAMMEIRMSEGLQGLQVIACSTSNHDCILRKVVQSRNVETRNMHQLCLDIVTGEDGAMIEAVLRSMDTPEEQFEIIKDNVLTITTNIIDWLQHPEKWTIARYTLLGAMQSETLDGMALNNNRDTMIRFMDDIMSRFHNMPGVSMQILWVQDDQVQRDGMRSVRVYILTITGDDNNPDAKERLRILLVQSGDSNFGVMMNDMDRCSSEK